MIPLCELERCPMHVARLFQDDERGHLCPGHAYALVIVIEQRDPAEWFKDWCPLNWPAEKKAETISTFLNACKLVAEAHREELLAWRGRHPGQNADRQN